MKKIGSIMLAVLLVAMLVPAGAKAAGKVAETGGVKYASVQNAVDAAESGAKVTLLADVTENVTVAADQNIVLELNGFVLSGGGEANKKPAVTNMGTVVIQDSSAAGTGKIIRESNRGPADMYVLDNAGTMTILSGTIYNNSGNNGRGASLIRNGGDGRKNTVNRLVVSGGTLQQDHFIAVKNDDYGTFVMNGGKVISEMESAIQNWGTATIEGGEVQGAIYTSVWNAGIPCSKTNITGDVVVTGRLIVNRTGAASLPAPVVNISGGALDVDWSRVEVTDGVSVDGGFFSNDDVMPFVTDDAMALSISRDGESIFMIGEYVNAVVDIAEAGDTVDVLQNIASIEKMPAGVTVNNKSANEVEVNGKKVAANGSTVTEEEKTPSEKPVVPPTTVPEDNPVNGTEPTLAPKTADMAKLPTVALVLVGCAVAGLLAVKRKEA